MTDAVSEARLTKTEHGLVPDGEGWFVLNARDARWVRSEERGQDTDFEGKQEWTQLGFRIQIIAPGQRGMYHRERGQEGFLVVSGECLLLVEGQERPLRAWDFVHSPGGTNHMIVGAGSAPSVVVAVGGRGGRKGLVYPVEPLARAHGVGVDRETAKPQEAYAPYPRFTRCRYGPGWLPE
jgi:quercetin dioxygenase-like cupin family protein